jgi:hypothetical protein
MPFVGFSEAVRDRLRSELWDQGLSNVLIDQAFARWDAKQGPQTPAMRLCFLAFERVRDRIATGELDARGDERAP